MADKKLTQAVDRYKRWINGDSKDKSYPEQLEPNELSIMRWCLECHGGEGYVCNQQSCPLYKANKSIILIDDRDNYPYAELK